MAARYQRLPSPVRAAIARAVAPLPAQAGGAGVWARGKRLAETGGMPPARRYALDMMQFDPWVRAELCAPQFLASAGVDDPAALMIDEFEACDGADDLDAKLCVDVNWYLPDALLVKVDIATMAHGLEGRSPLLDHRFMEWAAQLPADFKRRGSTSKYIFKQAVGPLLPAEIIDRPKKGFSVPLELWFRGELKEMAHDTLLGRRAMDRGYFRRQTVERLLSEHVTGVKNWHEHLWNLLMLELWHRTFIDERPTMFESPASASPPICAA